MREKFQRLRCGGVGRQHIAQADRALVEIFRRRSEVHAERQRQRGTAAHNTVVVDGQDSSEVWSAFRVARRARVHGVEAERQGASLRLTAWHDGYLRLPGRVRHRRAWQLSAQALVVEDVLEGAYHEAEAQFLFAPGATSTLRWQVEGGEARMVEAAWWHPLHATDLGLTWLRGIVADVAASLTLSPALPGQRQPGDAHS